MPNSGSIIVLIMIMMVAMAFLIGLAVSDLTMPSIDDSIKQIETLKRIGIHNYEVIDDGRSSLIPQDQTTIKIKFENPKGPNKESTECSVLWGKDEDFMSYWRARQTTCTP